MPRKNRILFITLITFRLATATGQIPAGESLDIGGFRIFPDNNPWNWDISSYPVHPNSDH